MAAQRIAPVEPPYPAEVQEAFDVVMRGAPPLLLFRTVANNPRVLQRMMAGGLLDRGSISMRARELMILRTCARCGAAYEWGVHVATFAAKAGIDARQQRATVHGTPDDDCWDGDDGVVLRLADRLHETNGVDDALWADAAARFSPPQLVELVMLAGLYHAVAYLANALRVAPEPFAPAFPD
jgi:alkylhydroperoxidase family enzyme